MKIKLPIKALSINRAWMGRRFKTKDYKQFEEDCIKLISFSTHGQTDLYEERAVEIHYTFYIKNYSMTDVSNLVKLLEDILVKCEIIKDDRYVISFTATKIKSKADKIVIEILPFLTHSK